MGDIKAIRSIRHDYALVNLCWRSAVAVLSFVCLETASRKIFFCNFSGTETNLYLHRSWPSWMGATFAFFQSLNSHSCHNLSKMIENSLITTLHSSLITLICIPCGPKNLCISIWLKCSIIPSSFVVGNASLCQWTHGSGRPENSLTTANADTKKTSGPGSP